MLLKINRFQSFIILLGLSFNFANWAADSSTDVINSRAELNAVIKIAKHESRICGFAGCEKSVNYKSARLHYLAWHASEALRRECSLPCSHVGCDYMTLQRTNLYAHEIAKHGLKRPNRRPRKDTAEAVVAATAPKAAKRARMAEPEALAEQDREGEIIRIKAVGAVKESQNPLLTKELAKRRLERNEQGREKKLLVADCGGALTPCRIYDLNGQKLEFKW